MNVVDIFFAALNAFVFLASALFIIHLVFPIILLAVILFWLRRKLFR